MGPIVRGQILWLFVFGADIVSIFPWMNEGRACHGNKVNICIRETIIPVCNVAANQSFHKLWASVFSTYLPEEGEKPTKCCLINAFIPARSCTKFIPEEVEQDISMCSGHFQMHSSENMQIILAEVHSLPKRRLLIFFSQKPPNSLLY